MWELGGSVRCPHEPPPLEHGRFLSCLDRKEIDTHGHAFPAKILVTAVGGLSSIRFSKVLPIILHVEPGNPSHGKRKLERRPDSIA